MSASTVAVYVEVPQRNGASSGMSSETFRGAPCPRRPPAPLVRTRPDAPRAPAACHASTVRSTFPDIEMATTRSAAVRPGAT